MLLPIPKRRVLGHGRWQAVAVCLVAFSCPMLLEAELNDSCHELECLADLQPGSASSLLQLGRARESSKIVDAKSSKIVDGFDGLLAPLNDAGLARVASL